MGDIDLHCLRDMAGTRLALRAGPITTGRRCPPTGYGQPDNRERARAAGFDHRLTKPVDAAELARLLASFTPT